MIGKRSENVSLFDVGYVWSLELSPKSFYYQLAVAAKGGLFNDQDFAELYCSNNGRPSVPPSLLAYMIILQTHDGVSDEQAVEHSAFDLRWVAVLGREPGKPLCAKSTLQLFRAHLMLHKRFKTLLTRSIDQAKASGLISDKALCVALDTKPMLGYGAALDTYNLLAQAMRQLSRALAKSEGKSDEAFLDEHGLNDLAKASIKGTAVVDWSDEGARNTFLTGLVKQARQLLDLSRGALDTARDEAELLGKILIQDIEEKPEGPGLEATTASIRQETVRDRIPSVTDPEQRHGRKSASKRFNGHKSSVVAETQSGIILSCDVLAGNAGDATGAVKQVEEAEQNVEQPISEVLADCAYGGAETRKAFADADRELLAKVPAQTKAAFAKSAFQIDTDNNSVKCPGGYTSFDRDLDLAGRSTFYFDEFCTLCPLRQSCTTSKYGRSISVHPNEKELGLARQFQNSLEGRAKLRQRLIVENALARLSRYGIGQARYIGCLKGRFQLTAACAVANLRRAWRFQLAAVAA